SDLEAIQVFDPVFDHVATFNTDHSSDLALCVDLPDSFWICGQSNVPGLTLDEFHQSVYLLVRIGKSLALAVCFIAPYRKHLYINTAFPDARQVGVTAVNPHATIFAAHHRLVEYIIVCISDERCSVNVPCVLRMGNHRPICHHAACDQR